MRPTGSKSSTSTCSYSLVVVDRSVGVVFVLCNKCIEDRAFIGFLRYQWYGMYIPGEFERAVLYFVNAIKPPVHLYLYLIPVEVIISMSSCTSDRLLDARVAALETKLGLRSSSVSKVDVESRLNALQATVDKHTTPQFRSVWKESMDLLRELDPGPGLTHQQQPLLYKRQEVLAAAETLEKDMGELAKILHLLSQGRASASSTPLREDAVTQAPILTNLSVSPEDQRRLDALRVTFEDLNTRTRVMALRLNQLLECYHSVMSAASEKCILADELLSAREAT